MIRWGLVGIGAKAAFAVGFVVLIVAFEPDHLAVAFEGEHVGGDAIQEPAVMADHHGAAGEVEERVFEGSERVDVEIVGRLIKEEDVSAPLSGVWRDARGCAHHRRAGRPFFAGPGRGN